MSAPVVRLEGVRLSRGGRRVLELPELSFEPGLTVVEGENGSGKTSLLLAAAGLLDLDSGAVWLDDTLFHRGRAPAPRALRLRLAIAFQDPVFFSGSVLRNVAFGLRCRGLPAGERRRRALAVLGDLGLSALAARPASRLSVGEKKLADLARARVLEPEVLFLDEPTASLDENGSRRVEEFLKGCGGEGCKACTVVLVTHDAGLAGRLSCRRLRLEGGRLKQPGPDSSV
jgi:tungstate transport system ATP-binding protein